MLPNQSQAALVNLAGFRPNLIRGTVSGCQQSVLDAIAQSEVDLKEGRVITAEEFRKKYARYGI